MNAVPFKPEHLEQLRAQPEQARELAALTPAAAAIAAEHDAWTFMDGDEVMACGGIVPYQGIGVLWSVVSASVGVRMISLTRMCQRYLALMNGPIETAVRANFGPGCRWAELLGFRRDAFQPGEGFDGCDLYRYVRGC